MQSKKPDAARLDKIVAEARRSRYGLAPWQKKYNCAPILIKMGTSSSHIESCHAE